MLDKYRNPLLRKDTEKYSSKANEWVSLLFAPKLMETQLVLSVSMAETASLELMSINFSDNVFIVI